MTGKSALLSRAPLTVSLLLAVSLLGGCLASRAPVPTQDQRTPEAVGRKARMEREAAEAGAQPAAEAKGEAKAAEPKPAIAVEAAKATPEAKGDAAPAKAESKSAEPKPAEPKPAEPSPAQTEAAPAKAEAAQAKAEPALAKAEASPALNAEQLPAQELTLQGHFVQIASFGTEKNAQNAVAWLSANGYPSSRVVRVEQGGVVLHRVQAGPFQDPAAARGALDALKGQWPQAFIPAD